MPARTSTALLAIALAGCSMRADFSDTSFLCDDTSPCPDPQMCIGGVCRAGPLDAGEPALLAWETTAALPEARDYNLPHAASAGGAVYLVGGYDAAEADGKTTVYRAEVGAGGALAAWSESTALPQRRSLADLAVVDDRIYVIGGSAATAAQNTVYQALVASNGSVGAWSATTPLPERRKGLTTFAASGHLYALGGEDENGDMTSTAFVARIEENGTLGAWSRTDDLPEARSAAAGVYVDGAIYLLGGVNQSSAIAASCFVAPVDAGDGSIGPWSETTELPTARRSAVAFALRGYIYLVGGLTDAGATDEVIHALIGQDRDLGSWQENSPLPAARARHAGVLAGQYFYVIGGLGAEDGTVFYTATD